MKKVTQLSIVNELKNKGYKNHGYRQFQEAGAHCAERTYFMTSQEGQNVRVSSVGVITKWS